MQKYIKCIIKITKHILWKNNQPIPNSLDPPQTWYVDVDVGLDFKLSNGKCKEYWIKEKCRWWVGPTKWEICGTGVRWAQRLEWIRVSKVYHFTLWEHPWLWGCKDYGKEFFLCRFYHAAIYCLSRRMLLLHKKGRFQAYFFSPSAVALNFFETSRCFFTGLFQGWTISRGLEKPSCWLGKVLSPLLPSIHYRRGGSDLYPSLSMWEKFWI